MASNKVETYINCHVKKTKRKGESKCILCLAESKFVAYEKCLYNVQYRIVSEEDDNNVRNQIGLAKE